MANFDFKSATPDATFPSGGFLFGADSQSAATPSIYSGNTYLAYILSLANTWTATQTITPAANTNALASTGYSLTGSNAQSLVDLAGTWNTTGTPTAIKLNITDTASNATSLLMDLQRGGVSQFNVRRDGVIVASNSFRIGSTIYAGGSVAFSSDAFLTRIAAAHLRLGSTDAASPVAQTLSVQSVVAGTSNTAGANFTITGSQGTGTGAGGSIIFQVAPAGSSGTSQNTLVNYLSIGSDRSLTFSGSLYDIKFTFENDGRALYVGGNINPPFQFQPYVSTFGLGSAAVLGWGSSSVPTTSNIDTKLFRDAANTLALRNGTNAQAFRIYNTYTASDNFERGNIFWDSNVLKIGTSKGASGGTARALEFQTDGVTRLTIGATGDVTTIGLFTSGGSVRAGINSSITWGASGTRAKLVSPSDGVVRLANDAQDDFNRLQFGGTTSSFPALKRSSTTLQVRLADDSDYASVQGKLTTETAYTASAPTPTGYLVLYDSNGTAYKVPAEAL